MKIWIQANRKETPSISYFYDWIPFLTKILYFNFRTKAKPNNICLFRIVLLNLMHRIRSGKEINPSHRSIFLIKGKNYYHFKPEDRYHYLSLLPKLLAQRRIVDGRVFPGKLVTQFSLMDLKGLYIHYQEFLNLNQYIIKIKYKSLIDKYISISSLI